MGNAAENNCNNCTVKDLGIFCNNTVPELDEISKHKITNHYKKGQTLFVQGNHPFGIYCVKKGNIKLTKVGQEGKESIVRIVKNGEILGHRSIFDHAYYSATATAIEDTTVCFLDKKHILKLIAENPSISLKIIEILSHDMGMAENKLSSYHQKNVRERLAELLLTLKETHGEKIADVGAVKWKINLKLTREEMATMIGTANETLIRYISEFKEEDLIEQNGKFIIIKNTEKLLDWANIQQ